jgi:hypothetical protein
MLERLNLTERDYMHIAADVSCIKLLNVRMRVSHWFFVSYFYPMTDRNPYMIPKACKHEAGGLAL